MTHAVPVAIVEAAEGAAIGYGFGLPGGKIVKDNDIVTLSE
jgi:hypothetical protein